MTSNKVESYEQCPLCADDGYDTAEDNLVTFVDSGVKHCHRHGLMGIDGKFDKTSNINQKHEKVEHMSETGLILDGEYAGIRGISRDTCKFYGYQIHKERGLHIANYYDDAGNLKMQQWRTPEKQFPTYGNKSFNETLWGMHKFSPNDNLFITITEGQIDTLSIAEIFACKYPVVSLPIGVGGEGDNNKAFTCLRKNLHYLNKFKYVVLAFDNDAPGIEATEACIKLFEPGKVRIAKFELKDANEYIKADRHKDLRDIIYNAVTYMPEPVLYGDKLITNLKGFSYATKEWPHKQANKMFNKIKKPGIISVVGRPKRGKTEFMKSIAQFELSKGGNIAYISTEQSPAETFIRQVGAQEGIDLIGNVANRSLTDDELALCEKYKDRIVIYDHLEFGQTIDSILNNIPYLVRALNCEYVILDNLSTSSSSTGGDERRNLDKALADIKRLTSKYNFTLWNVMHIKRGTNGSMLTEEGEDEVPDVEMIRGTQAIEMYSDMVIAVHRNMKHPDLKIQNRLGIYCLADRQPGNKVGNSYTVDYNPKYKWLEE